MMNGLDLKLIMYMKIYTMLQVHVMSYNKQTVMASYCPQQVMVGTYPLAPTGLQGISASGPDNPDGKFITTPS